MGLREDILALAAYHGGRELVLADDDDLLGAFGMEGDDASDFLEAFSERFAVDLSGLLSYFHYNGDEPPPARPRLYPVSPDGERLPLRPITLKALVDAAELGRWQLAYPPHEVRERFSARLLRWLLMAFLPIGIAFLLWDLFYG